MSDSEAFERITSCEARIDRLVSLPFVQTLRALFEAEGRDFNEPDLRRVRAELSLRCERVRMGGMQVNDLDAMRLQEFIPELAEYWGRPNPVRLDSGYEAPSRFALHMTNYGDLVDDEGARGIQRRDAGDSAARQSEECESRGDLELNACESDVLDALRENGPLRGSKLASTAGYQYSSYFRSSLAAMVRRGLIGNDKRGYFPQCQDSCQD
jgi:hypothetical protein